MNFEIIASLAKPHIRKAGGDKVTRITPLPPGMGYLVYWDSNEGGLIGNTPFFVNMDGDVRWTWPFEFDHLLPKTPEAEARITPTEDYRRPPPRPNKRYGPGFYD